MKASRSPLISVVVVAWDMPREIVRTLRSLSPEYQVGATPEDYEVIVVDNQSPTPLDLEALRDFGPNFHGVRVQKASPSPAHAVNLGVGLSRGEIVGVLVDGARLATPGLIQYARRAFSAYEDPTVATLSWHLGWAPQQESVPAGYDQSVEDRLLAGIGWPKNGYRLFEIATLAPSSGSGFFLPIHESNAIFLRRTSYDAIGGFDEAFDLPGGGFANLDFFKRACERDGAPLVLLLGEGTFHQAHGGISTDGCNVGTSEMREQWARQYQALRGTTWQPPRVVAEYLGSVPPAARAVIGWSAQEADGADVAGARGAPSLALVNAAADTRARRASLDPFARRYVELLRQSLLNENGLDAEVAYYYARECAERNVPFDPARLLDPRATLEDLHREVSDARRDGRHPDRDLAKIGFSTTMIGRRRLESLEDCILDVVGRGVPGDLIECGVWRGGATIFMRGVLEALAVTDRVVWVADSFQGLPAPDAERGDPDLSAERVPQLVVSRAQVESNFERLGLLDDRVRFLEGWFEDTLAAAPIARLAILRIDADYYASTRTCLAALYDKLSEGGYVIIDDYSLIPACRSAVDDFRSERDISSPLEPVDSSCVLWRRERR